MCSPHQVEENKMPNAIIAAGTVISIGNVLQHHDPHREVEEQVVVVGIREGVEEDEEVVEEDHSQLEPLWSRRDQMQLAQKCMHSQLLPQCLVLILRDLDRETSCALLWTA